MFSNLSNCYWPYKFPIYLWKRLIGLSTAVWIWTLDPLASLRECRTRQWPLSKATMSACSKSRPHPGISLNFHDYAQTEVVVNFFVRGTTGLWLTYSGVYGRPAKKNKKRGKQKKRSQPAVAPLIFSRTFRFDSFPAIWFSTFWFREIRDAEGKHFPPILIKNAWRGNEVWPQIQKS